MYKEHPNLFIGGAWVAGETGRTEPVINPATEETIGVAPVASRADVAKAITAARTAFDDGPWPQMTMKERSVVLLRMADVMEKRFEELVQLNIAESGGTRIGAESFQIGFPLTHFRDLAERVMIQFPVERAMPPHVGGTLGQGVIRREPWGVASLISAYNFPFFLNMMKLGPALAAGCTTILKPAPTTPLEAFILGEIAEEAGLPAGVLNIVAGDTDAGLELTTNPMVDIVSFTGSDTVGRKVFEQAAPTVKKVILELGGKSANIICEDADLGKVVGSVVRDIVLHAGQGCAFLTRTVVHRSRHDELIELVTEALKKVKVGDPALPDTVMGPVGSAAQRARVEKLIQTGIDEGATLAVGGGRPHGLDKGFFIEPTLFVDVENSMAIAQQEFFGPVGVVIPFDDEDEAVRIANDSDFGLAGGVWSKDPVRAYDIAKRIRTGTVTVNGGGGGMSPHGSFGGYKQSGLGRERGDAGLDEFLQTKTITWPVASG
ncbi:aldehyde dehydrogenase family protein [Rhodococcus sp. 14-2470-1a]|uniref:aldehyde dehydrogenase family protein n=1 Tax=Rhodococcus sp. 14-2470-1a TaxID=2023150 RepID=UPI000B9ABEC8|nr:aldehyde dehydrogenase family protein [Rhodococcus sp. 14-2470-1a]OZF45799.1 aldehyde dehydrogenase [Rhodococcus sp. 14-2470-1a]